MLKTGTTIPATLVLVVAMLTGTTQAQSSPARTAGVERHHHVPTLGVKGAEGRYGRGWGKVRPKHIFNGGDPSGNVTHVRWSSWGGHSAHGKGKNAIFKPHGGYYPKQVTIKLTATKLKVCHSTGKLTYSTLIGQEPKRPGGPDGKPFVWNGHLCKKANY